MTGVYVKLLASFAALGAGAAAWILVALLLRDALG